METTQAIVAHVSSLSYLGIFIMALLANIVVPVPEEVVLIAIGYVLGMGNLSWVLVGVLVFLGLFTSDFIMYELSYRGNRWVRLIYEKYFSKLVPFDSVFIHAHVKKIIVISRFLVQLRFLSPFFAGYTKTPRKVFALYSSLALIIYIPLYVFIGFYFRSRFESIISGIGEVKNIILIIIGIVLLVGFTKSLKAFFLGRFRFGFSRKEGYTKTWIPGLQKKSGTVPEKHFHVHVPEGEK